MIKEFKLKKAGSNLLELIKVIKIASKLGLKETKELVDKVRDKKGPVLIKLNLNESEEKTFLDDLSNLKDVVWEYPTTSSIRKIKFAQLGLVENKDELISIINDFSSLEEVLKLLPNETLIGIINKINPYVQSNI